MYQYQRQTTHLCLGTIYEKECPLAARLKKSSVMVQSISHQRRHKPTNQRTPSISFWNFSRQVHFISTQNRNFWKNHLFLPMLYLSSSFCLISVRARARLLPSL